MKLKLNIIALCFLFLGASKNLVAQPDFYAIDHIPEVRVYFTQSNWDELLDSLYILGSEYRLGANVTIDGIEYNKVGVRYKGFSSYSSSRNKNPLNIDLDYIYPEQSHQGFHKVKLSNVIQDPSFVREVLSYDVAKKYMPASKANYANVYINDTLIGLYTNVEAVNGKFLEENFGESSNTFIKCNPTTIDLNGENANFGNSPGTNYYDYEPFYKVKSDNWNDWTNLYEFIDVLNNSPQDVEQLLNIDRTLWMHAVNYSIINFDSYVGYAQNFYVYKDNNGQFNPILWDMNMSFASYRLTDASDFWDSFTIEEAKTIDPLQHLNSFSVQPRPLIRNIIQTPMYERMYMAHITTIIEENFENGWYETQAQYYQSIIDASVQADTNKFYSYNDFLENIDSTVSDLVDYPGIIDLMEDRTAYLMSYPGVQYRPEIQNVAPTSNATSTGDDLWITADVTGAVNDVYLAYRFANTETFTVVSMYDDGLNQDGAVGDDTYGALISEIPNLVQYYIYAENDSSGRFSPARAAFEFYEHVSAVSPLDIAINEVMSTNSVVESDLGEYVDWVELYNNTAYAINLNEFYLSNDPSNLMKWQLPDYSLPNNAYSMIWLDDSILGDFHANFNLDEFGDSIWISNASGVVIDNVVLGEQNNITSYGRSPNGTGSFIEMKPTPEASNTSETFGFLEDEFFVFPNPTNGEFYIKTNLSSTSTVNVYSLLGRQMMPSNTLESNGMLTLSSDNLADGIYLIHFEYEGNSTTKKIIVTH